MGENLNGFNTLHCQDTFLRLQKFATQRPLTPHGLH